MTVQDYERQNGFREELAIVREIGIRLTTLEEMIPARPHREPERQAMAAVKDALVTLRDEIAKTRNT
jgi:hypothetical protein